MPIKTSAVLWLIAAVSTCKGKTTSTMLELTKEENDHLLESLAKIMKPYNLLSELLDNRKKRAASMEDLKENEFIEGLDGMDDGANDGKVPYFNYRQILKSQRWKRMVDAFNTALDLGKISA